MISAKAFQLKSDVGVYWTHSYKRFKRHLEVGKWKGPAYLKVFYGQEQIGRFKMEFYNDADVANRKQALEMLKIFLED